MMHKTIILFYFCCLSMAHIILYRLGALKSMIKSFRGVKEVVISLPPFIDIANVPVIACEWSVTEVMGWSPYVRVRVRIKRVMAHLPINVNIVVFLCMQWRVRCLPGARRTEVSWG